MSTPSPQLVLGQVIGSRYRVHSLIGRGGMGMVYSATHELTGRRVALKLMLSDTEDAPVLHDRFLSEARIAAAVRHPNIVDVLDMGLHGSAPFIVMELLEGRALEQVLEEHQALSVEQTLMWMFPIIGALSVLHEAGIVHRDVKPSNIFMSSLPRHPMRPKLLDFGLARVVSDLRLTRSGTVIGTPLYMAPEHAAGLSTGPQADVWSIGVVLYESLSGMSPFNYIDRSSLALQVLAGLVRPLAEARPDLPEAICNVIGRALQRDLARRYTDMRSLAEALHAAARASGIPVPADPDPIGLPEYARWQAGGHGATTHEVPLPTGLKLASGGGSGARVNARMGANTTPLTGLSGPQYGMGANTSLEMTYRTSNKRWLWLLPALLLAAAIGVWVLLNKPAESLLQPSSAPEAALSAHAPAPGASDAAQQAAPTVESLAAPPTTRSVVPPSPTPAATIVPAAPGSTKRRSRTERAAMRRATTPESEAVSEPKPASKQAKPAATPDEVESEWK